MYAEQQYLDLLNNIMTTGHNKKDRTGTGTLSVFGASMRFDLNEGFPLLTTKKIHLRSIVHELLWFLKGETNTKYLNDNNVTIWNSWKGAYSGFNTNTVIKIKKLKNKEYFIEGSVTHETILNKNKNIKLTDVIEIRLRHTWSKMINRCYNKNAHNYKSYGGKGVRVDSRWHDVRIFVSDVKKLLNFKYKLENWKDFELDKDYFGAKMYGPETCIWLHRNDNVHSVWLKLTSQKGEILICRTFKEASLVTGISKSSISRFVSHGVPSILKGNNKTKAGKWIIERAETSDHVYRHKLSTDKDLGPVYGKQWTDWENTEIVHNIPSEIKILKDKNYNFIGTLFNEQLNITQAVFRRSTNQIQKCLDLLRNDPDSRRIYVSAINVGELDQMALEPCHNYFQFYTRELDNDERVTWFIENNEEAFDKWQAMANKQPWSEETYYSERSSLPDHYNVPTRELSCFYLMRSADTFLGTPFNIASYALLTHMFAQQLNMAVGELLYQGVDVHLYSNHTEQVKEQLTRKPYPFPKLKLNKAKDIFSYTFEDVEVVGYQSHPAIKAPVAI